MPQRLAPETRIALTNLPTIARGRVLLAGVEAELARAVDGATIFQFDLRAARACAGIAATSFGPWMSEPGGFDTALLVLPKATERARMLVAMTARLVRGGGHLLLAGRNDTGIRSAGKHLEPFGDPEILDYRFHARLLRVEIGEPAAATSLDAWRETYSADVAGRSLEIVSYPGVFSHGRLDDGTRSLLGTIDVPDGSRAIDVGCGSGAIGAWLASGGVTVDCVDPDAFAVAAAQATLAVNGARGARAFASDLFSDAPGRYTHVVTNAPFHAGVRKTSEVAVRLIREAPDHLERGGELWLVANRFLDHIPTLQRSFATVEIAADDGRYRVYRAR